MKAVRVTAPAKLNLWLGVGDRDASGFHELDTLFCAVDLMDELTVQEGGAGLGLEVSGPNPCPPDENLVWRAARLFFSAARVHADVGIRLTKRIPVGAGLGGGSSDAAAVLRALAALFGPAETAQREALELMGTELGSDVPFFLGESPLARGRGRGQLLEPLAPLPVAPVLVAMPPYAMSTSLAYRLLDDARASGFRSRSREVAQVRAEPVDVASWNDVAQRSSNDFEPILFGLHPELSLVHQALVEAGAVLARLTGSGSGMFGIFPDEPTRRVAEVVMEEAFPAFQVFRAATLGAMPRVEAALPRT